MQEALPEARERRSRSRSNEDVLRSPATRATAGVSGSPMSSPRTRSVAAAAAREAPSPRRGTKRPASLELSVPPELKLPEAYTSKSKSLRPGSPKDNFFRPPPPRVWSARCARLERRTEIEKQRALDGVAGGLRAEAYPVGSSDRVSPPTAAPAAAHPVPDASMAMQFTSLAMVRSCPTLGRAAMLPRPASRLSLNSGSSDEAWYGGATSARPGSSRSLASIGRAGSVSSFSVRSAVETPPNAPNAFEGGLRHLEAPRRDGRQATGPRRAGSSRLGGSTSSASFGVSADES